MESLAPQHDTVDDLRAESLWVAEDEDGAICGLVGVENEDERSDSSRTPKRSLAATSPMSNCTTRAAAD